jgi:hypothetical protein
MMNAGNRGIVIASIVGVTILVSAVFFGKTITDIPMCSTMFLMVGKILSLKKVANEKPH